MNTKLKDIKNNLAGQGIKPTYQRLCVLEFLEQAAEHPTAEMIYENVVRKIPTMSRTTVYNTLNLFQESGIIHAVTITGTEARYGVAEHAHHHFLCRQCGKIYDIDVTCPFADGHQHEVEGHAIQEIHGYFKGICRDCH